MLQKFKIIGLHFSVSASLRKYIVKRLGNLDQYMPRHSRDSAYMEVRLKEEKASPKKSSICEVILHLPHATISLTEAASDMKTTINVVKGKLKQEIRQYKDELPSSKQRRHLFWRFVDHAT